MRFVRLTVLTALTAALFAQTTRLELGKAMQDDLSGGQTRSYPIMLEANQYLRAVVTQPVPAVVVELYSPDGKKALEVDTGNLPGKPSRIVWVAEAAGEYRINVSVPAKTAGTSHYEIKSEELRAAGPDDGKRVEAERLFTQALSEGRKYAYDQAILTYTRALDLYREVRDREREGDALNAAANASDDAGKSEKSIGYYEQALAVEREIKDRRGEGNTLNGMGLACVHLSQSEKAIGYFEQALAIRREVQDLKGVGATLNNLGLAYTHLSQYEKAISYYEQALATLREIKSRLGEGAVLSSLGIAYAHLSQFEKAIGYFEQASALQHEVKDRPREGGTLNNLGLTYYNLSQYEKAIRYYEQALEIRREVKDTRGEGATLNNLGIACRGLSQYEKAIRYYEQALTIFHESKDRQDEGTTLANIGNSYCILSQCDKAIGYFEQALALHREIKDPTGEGMALADLGDAYISMGQYNKAIGNHEQALAIFRETKDRYDEGRALHNLGADYAHLSQGEKAIGYFEQALALQRQVKDRSGEATTLGELGATYARMSQDGKAVNLYEEALAIDRAINDRSAEAHELSGLMGAWQTSGKPRLAIFYGKQAVNTIQSMRADIAGLGRDIQQSFLKGNEEPYHKLAEILIAQGRLAEAEQVLALLKEEEYFQYIRRDAGDASSLNRRADLTPDEAAYDKRYREIGDRLMSIGTERGELLAKKTLTQEQSQRLDQLEKDLAAGNQVFEHFLGDLTQHFSAKPDMAGRIRDLRETQGIMEDLRDLPAGTVAIFTLIADDKFYAILRTPDAQKSYEYPIKAADLNRKILAFHQVVQHPELDPRPLAQELYRILIGGMAADLRQAKAQTLMWELDGPLRYIPLAALYDGKQYLIERYRLSVMTLASKSRLKDPPAREWQAAGFGVTKRFEDASALPSVSSELTGIITTRPGDGGVLTGEIKLDEKFTQQSMRDTLHKRYPVIHIASHFRFQPGDDAKSFLLLGDGGHLTLAELKTWANLFGGVQLLTLSACNTGVGDGAEVEGFGALAQIQGAKAVVASLWPVADASTSRLMQEFYRIRQSSAEITKVEALREAQLALLRGTVQIEPAAERNRGVVVSHGSSETAPPEAPGFPASASAPYAHPYYWAPFFLMGNWL
jgi:CHAT domain-containing protein/Tfp pilus assembly protein PilF